MESFLQFRDAYALQMVLENVRGFTSIQSHERDTTSWRHPLAIPAYASSVSVVLLLLQTGLSLRSAKLPPSPLEQERHVGEEYFPGHASLWSRFKRHVSKLGGLTIFLFRITRVLCVLVLLALSIVTLFARKGHSDSSHPETTNSDTGIAIGRLAPNFLLGLAICLVYLYSLFLGVLSLVAGPQGSSRAKGHLVFVLLVTFAVYVYRDIWPLLTFTESPADLHEGPLIWAKIVFLGTAALVIPLTAPRQYVPVDPKEPASEPNPEQTASILSLAIYSFLDSTVFLANRLPHLPQEKLPPLADYDYATNLVKRSFPHLDPFSGARKGHMFFGLMRVFYQEYTVLSLMAIIMAFSGFISPLGINKLLSYLETGGEGAIVRPWVWISALFWAPMVSTLSFQWYIFVATATLVRSEAIITQLVFEHSLRIRMKAEASDSTSKSAPSTAVATPDNTSVVDEQSTAHDEARDETTPSETVSTAKGKQSPVKEQSMDSKDDDKFFKDGSAKASNLVGKINNLVSTDLANITEGRDFILLVLYAPLQLIVCVWFLYKVLGWSSFVGMMVMVLLFPVPGYVARLIQHAQVQTMKRTDARVQNVTETMNVLRMIKLFGWEPKTDARIADKREEELQWIKRRSFLEMGNEMMNYLIPVSTMVVTFATYTLIMKQELKPSTVFSSMAVFDLLRDQLGMILRFTSAIIQAKVSVDRVSDFLRNSELLDSFALQKQADAGEISLHGSPADPQTIGFHDAAFTWSNDADINGSYTPSKRIFRLQVEGDLMFKRGSINLIIGPTGSGKTSLLMALLGEMHFLPSGPDSWFNLPRDKGVAYAAQESWVQNETIRDNILFGAPYDEVRYNKVLYQCALKRDLTLFDAGDQTEVGEKGLTLSGGQKARVTLARAIYSSADIVLLDDILAALDVHTARWIVDKCLKGDLIRGRTLLLVTHNVAMAAPIADRVITVGLDGKVSSSDTVAEAIREDKDLSAEIKEEMEETEKALEEIDAEDPEAPDAKKADGKLTVEEDIALGHISWDAMKLYLTSLGGSHVALFWIAFMTGTLLVDASNISQTWFLGYWAEQYDIRPASEVRVSFYLMIYCLLALISVIIYSSAFVVYVFGSLRASRSIHRRLIESILGTTLRWLDTTPTSRVITRCTQDIRTIDGNISMYLRWLLEMSATLLMKFAAILFVTPIFVIPGTILTGLGGLIGQIYMKSQLSVKREMSVAKAPVLGHFGAAIAGLTSIRAYGAQKAFKSEAYNRINRYTRAARTHYNLNRWVCIRIDALGGLFTAGLAAYLIYGPSRNERVPSEAGFSITMAVSFSGIILYWVRILNALEVDGNSLERVQAYITIEQEPKPTQDGIPPAYWPSSGDLKVESLCARYSANGPEVLHDISFHVKSGERVGIVGRTGSGKSSLTLSLLRCIPTEGTVYYDGRPTSSINLDVLRTGITIIPQVPELLTGSLRENLDPFSQYDDAALNSALRASGLFSLQSEDDEGRITLDSTISSGGGNLSIGQRQIIALARALVRGSKLLILDEDHHTDSVIQNSLRRELGGDVTLITVAHRLQTIMDADKIASLF
ncbi:hypothetical protein EVG20_g7183 [Dentipellis fragilis]|uniref:P-loop containing nucleoside triphosphate hydrolase protein n=1 Tax=Dentipellis fragilis TaxID=205917 RepID=A0A4Y9YEX5_9AGAM|nr:hypothetical protein EVG20_g7183 [Dentipellis fragilis]